MITIVTQPAAYCLASGFGDVQIRSPRQVVLSLRVDSALILQETYTPASGDNIYIRDLGRLLLGYINKTTLVSTVELTLTATDDTKVITSRVQYATAAVNVPAETFSEASFLTLLQREKVTAVGQTEYLSLICTEETVVQARAKYANGNVTTLTLGTITVLNRVHTINASPSRFSNPQNIVHYVVNAGPRTMVYYVTPAPWEKPPQFVFLNAFGVKETFTPLGLITRENKYTNLFGSFAGYYRKHNVDLVREFTANTGVLYRTMADWIEDMFFSKDVFLLTPAGVQEEITILEATVKRTSAWTELPAFEFKYRLSSVYQHTFNVEIRQRIFDKSFDYTFN